MTSRELYERVGGFREHAKEVFWLEEPRLHRRHRADRLRPAVLADLKVHHTGGAYYCDLAREGGVLGGLLAEQARRAAIKKLVFRIPFVRRLNARFDWFVAPS